MFLMNPSALVALPRKWEPFSHTRSCRYPISFSESEEDLARTSVSAKVQMIIDNLQSEEPSLSSSSSRHAYGRLLQKKQKGSKGRAPKPRRGSRTLHGRMKCTRQTCPADSDGMEVEEVAEYAPLSLNSDSDDSVDRDIEEAIQEYLKNKSLNVQPLASCIKREAGEKQVQEEHSVGDPVRSVFHAHVEPDGTEECPAPERSGSEETKWAPSPTSVSSDDSFEQSIKAEIEQFLSEKKQQATRKVTGGTKWFDRRETQEKPAVRSQKEETHQASQSSQRNEAKALFFRRPPALRGTAVSKCLKSRLSDELADFKRTSRAHFRTSLAGRSLEQNGGGEKRPTPRKAGGEQRLESKNPSDSSSDDGIEEAIQLYQLEKIRNAAVTQRERISFRYEGFQIGGAEAVSASLAAPPVKRAVPDVRRKTLRRKRRPVLAKPAELNWSPVMCCELEKDKNCTFPENSGDKCALALQTCCRADTAAELMCAEAILDISKTILPPPTGGGSRSFTIEPAVCSQNGLEASAQESDSNPGDSDDGIEQEIQAFLAVKAQAERLVATAKGTSQPVHLLPSSGQPGRPAQSSKRMLAKPIKLSQSPKRRCKGESRMSTHSPGRHLIQPETNISCMGDACSETSTAHQGEEVEAGGAPWGQEGTQASVSSMDAAHPFSWGLLGSRNDAKTTRRNPPKYRSGDKSSSLDSDEDLDTAIKDLLRSKRKQKKKAKDQQIQCKKKVRFGGTETMHVLEEKGKACRSNPPTLLRSCLVGSRRDINAENATNEHQSTVKANHVVYEFKEEPQMKPFSEPDIQDLSQCPQGPWTARSLTNDSSSADSDDSIEEEIQRFLAEKAKDFTCAPEVPETLALPETLEAHKPQNSLPEAKCQALRRQGRAPSNVQRRRDVKKGGPPMLGLRGSPRSGKMTVGKASHEVQQTVTRAEDTQSQAAVMLQAPAQRTAPESRRVISTGKLAERDLPWKEETKDPAQRSHLQPLGPLKRKRPCEFRTPSKFVSGVKSTRPKMNTALGGKRLILQPALLTRQGRVAASGLCIGRCERTLQRGTPASRIEAGAEAAELSSTFGAEGWHACIAEKKAGMEVSSFCSEMVNLAMLWPLGPEGPCQRADPSPGSPTEEPPAGASIDTGLSPVETPRREEKVQERLVSGREGKVPIAPSDLPLRETSGIDQGKAAEVEALRALEESSAEFADRLMEEYMRCLGESKAPNL